jgi:hypothetical protein
MSNAVELAMIENSPRPSPSNPVRTYPGMHFSPDPGERWRRFLERIGTRNNDFASRLSRARFVYLHRREAASHWLPL